jgi:hypothetical protein
MSPLTAGALDRRGRFEGDVRRLDLDGRGVKRVTPL